MSLSLPIAKKMLREIVGGTGFGTSYAGPRFVTSYLGLSSTLPSSDTPGDDGNYGVTEPSAESYGRVNLTPNSTTPYFPTDGTGELVEGKYVVTTTNELEIHFNEALTDWGRVKYFVIYDGLADKQPKYYGELIYDHHERTELTEEEYNTLVPQGVVYTRDSSTGDYELVEDGTAYDLNETYYVWNDEGIYIKKDTVPLVRKNQLIISVQ